MPPPKTPRTSTPIAGVLMPPPKTPQTGRKQVSPIRKKEEKDLSKLHLQALPSPRSALMSHAKANASNSGTPLSTALLKQLQREVGELSTPKQKPNRRDLAQRLRAQPLPSQGRADLEGLDLDHDGPAQDAEDVAEPTSKTEKKASEPGVEAAAEDDEEKEFECLCHICKALLVFTVYFALSIELHSVSRGSSTFRPCFLYLLRLVPDQVPRLRGDGVLAEELLSGKKK